MMLHGSWKYIFTGNPVQDIIRGEVPLSASPLRKGSSNTFGPAKSNPSATLLHMAQTNKGE